MINSSLLFYTKKYFSKEIFNYLHMKKKKEKFPEGINIFSVIHKYVGDKLH